MRRLIIFAIVAACAIHHHVRILLGPTPDTVSSGFLCDDPANPGQPLVARALVIESDGPHLQFSLVVDIVDLGGTFPGCLAEDVRAACLSSGACRLSTNVAPVRKCLPLDVPIKNNDPIRSVNDYLHENDALLVRDAPDVPVIVRVVATTESCAALMIPNASGNWPNLHSDATKTVLGCAYSCPIVLDEARDQISLGIDIGLSNIDSLNCPDIIAACAAFPGVP